MKLPKIREAKRVRSIGKQILAEKERINAMLDRNEYPDPRTLRHLNRRREEAEHKLIVPLHAEDIIRSGNQLTNFMDKVKPKVYARRLSKKLKEGKALLSRNNSEVIADKILAPEIAQRVASFL